MRKITILAFALFLGTTFGLEAVTYRLFVHGRSNKNHCSTISNVNSATTDVNSYWGGVVKGIANIRYIGFNPNAAGGAYSTASCGAQTQLAKAIQVFCTGSNDCEIYTHSTGGLVAANFFAKNAVSTAKIKRIQLMANAAGGSELANAAVMVKFAAAIVNIAITGDTTWVKNHLNFGGPIDVSVSTSGARNGFNHNVSNGRTYYTTSGTGIHVAGITKPFLPGEDDSVVANHSLCNVNKIANVNVNCPKGSGVFKDALIEKHTRWTPYVTIYGGGITHNHRDAESDYNRR